MMVLGRKLIAVVGAVALASIALPVVAQELPGKFIVDFPCAQEMFSARRSIFGGLPGRIPGVDRLLPEPNAVCQANGLVELLLLTGRMTDRTAYAAAKGVDAVQLALGRQRTFLVPIADLERAAGGLQLGDPDKTEVLIQQVSAVSRELLLEVRDMKEAMRKDPEVIKNLDLAQLSLNEVEYYGVTASIGGALFGRRFTTAPPQEKAGVALGLQRVGLATDFAERLPGRSTKVHSAIGDTIALQSGISKVAKNAEEGNAGDKRAKEQVKKDLDEQRVEWQKGAALGK